MIKELKDLWNDPNGPGKLLLVGTTIYLLMFFYLIIIVASRGRWII